MSSEKPLWNSESSLAMLSLLTLILWLPRFNAQSTNSARALDALLQDYAYRAFVLPRTGIPYDGIVPSNLTGIKIAAMRLRSGSLKSRGVRMYKEFGIPEGVVVRPYVERVVLVYQNLGNWSGTVNVSTNSPTSASFGLMHAQPTSSQTTILFHPMAIYPSSTSTSSNNIP